MFRHIAVISVGLAAIINLNAGQIQIGQGNLGLTNTWMTSGVGSVGTATLANYDATLFSGATNGGTAPKPFTGYSNTAGTAATPGSTITGSNGITFDMISDTATPSDADYWNLLGNTPTVVIPVGVFGVKQVWTMLNDATGVNANNAEQVTYSFGSSANDTGADVQTVTIDFVNGDEVRDAVDCTGGGAACTSITYATGILASTNSVSNTGSAGAATYNITALNLFTSLYTAGTAGAPYTNTSGSLNLDEQGIGFGATFANQFLVSVKITDLTGSDTAVSAVTVVTAVPEPSTVFLFAAGLGALGFTRLRLNRRRQQS